MTAPERATSVVRPVFDVAEWRAYQAAEFIPTRDKLLTAAAQATGLADARAYRSCGFILHAACPSKRRRSRSGAGGGQARRGRSRSADCSCRRQHACGRSQLALADLGNPAVAVNIDLNPGRRSRWRGCASGRRRARNSRMSNSRLRHCPWTCNASSSPKHSVRRWK